MLYSEYQEKTAPAWATGRNFSAWWQAHGLMKDVIVDGARIATKANWPLATPPDGLAFIGWERSLIRVPSDTDETYRATLHEAWDLWDFGGTKIGIQAAIARRWPASNPYPMPYWENPAAFGVDDTQWARWKLFVTMDGWDAPAKWGSGVRWGDPYLQWGVRAPLGELAELKNIIRTWAEAETVLTQIIVTTPGGVLELAPLWPPLSPGK